MSDSEPRISKADELRATTKWIMAGAVALASALIALAPTVYPTNKEFHTSRIVVLFGAAALTMVSIGMVIFSASKVLGPRPTTIRDLLRQMDDRSKKAATQQLTRDLDRSRMELLPPDVESVRRLWTSRLEGTITESDFRLVADRVLAYCDERLTGRYFSGLLRSLASFGVIAVVGTLTVTVGLATTPNDADLVWLDSPIPVALTLSGKGLPDDCLATDPVLGYLLATDRNDSRFLFTAIGTESCSSFSTVLDAQNVPLLPLETSVRDTGFSGSVP